MYPHQTERLTAALDRAGADALVATSAANVAYVTGFHGLSDSIGPATRMAIFSRQGTALVAPASDIAVVAVQPLDVDHLVAFGEWAGAFADSRTPVARRLQAIVGRRVGTGADALAEALESLEIRGGSVAFDESGVSHEDWDRVSQRLGAIKMFPAAGHFANARRVKGPYEIEAVGQALRIVEEALDAVIQTMDRGMTERDAARLYAEEVLKRGAWPRLSVIAIGDHAAIATPWPTDRGLRKGDVVRFDVACVHRGYHGRLARSAVLGDPAPAQESAYRAIQAGLEAAIAAIVPGVAGGRVYQATRQAVRADGLPQYELSEAGHGIGLDQREQPALAAGGEATLEMGEVLTVHVPYYEIGWTGVGVMDTVLVTSAGARVLNRSERGLVILD